MVSTNLGNSDERSKCGHLPEIKEENPEDIQHSRFIIPNEAYNHYTQNEVKEHERLRSKQEQIYAESDETVPFLNRIETAAVTCHTEFLRGELFFR